MKGVGKIILCIVLVLMLIFPSSISTSYVKTVAGQTTSDVSIVSGASTSSSADCAANNCFSPNPLTVAVGAAVTWTNDDKQSHTVTSGKISDNDPGSMFNSDLIKPGNTFQFTFANPGTYDYFCAVHPWMMGQIIVSTGNVNSQSTTPTTPTSQSVSENPNTVNVQITQGSGSDSSCASTNNCFSPNTITVSSGTTVTWINNDLVAHTITSGKPSDSQTGTVLNSVLKSGQDFSFTFQDPGTFDYFDETHPWMIGQIIVQGSTTQPQQSTQQSTSNSHSHTDYKNQECLGRYGTGFYYDVSRDKCMPPSGSWDNPGIDYQNRYCQAKYGSGFYFDSSQNACLPPSGSWDNPGATFFDHQCQEKFWPDFYYDSSQNACLPPSGSWQNFALPQTGVTDQNGLVTLQIRDKNVPFQFVDDTTGSPLVGFNVAFALDPTTQSIGALVLLDPSKHHPMQIIVLTGSTKQQSNTPTSWTDHLIPLASAAPDNLVEIFTPGAKTTLIIVGVGSVLTSGGTVPLAITAAGVASLTWEATVTAMTAADKLGWLPVSDFLGKHGFESKSITFDEFMKSARDDTVMGGVSNSILLAIKKLHEPEEFAAGLGLIGLTGLMNIDTAAACVSNGEDIRELDVYGEHLYFCEPKESSYGWVTYSPQESRPSSIDFVSKANGGFSERVQAYGDEPVPMPAGDYTVRILAPGNQPLSQDISVTPQKTTTISTALQPLSSNQVVVPNPPPIVKEGSGYDGTYTLHYMIGGDNLGTCPPANFGPCEIDDPGFTIQNGQITDSNGYFSGSVDVNGHVDMKGTCPQSSPLQGHWSGTYSGSSTFKGDYMCLGASFGGSWILSLPTAPVPYQPQMPQPKPIPVPAPAPETANVKIQSASCDITSTDNFGDHYYHIHVEATVSGPSGAEASISTNPSSGDYSESCPAGKQNDGNCIIGSSPSNISLDVTNYHVSSSDSRNVEVDAYVFINEGVASSDSYSLQCP